MRGSLAVLLAVALAGGGASAGTRSNSREAAAKERSAGAARPAPPPSTCSGVYSGAARGVFRCRVIAVHRAATQRSKLAIDIDQNAPEAGGDALAQLPGGLEWIGEIAPGTHSLADASVASAWSSLETGRPDKPFDYIAAKAWWSYPVEQGDVAVTLTQVLPGPVTDGVQSYEVHGTLSARLLPYPVSGGASGMVRVKATF